MATTDAVAARSLKSAPSNTAARSAWIAAGPVTCASMPSGVTSSSCARSAFTASAVSVAPVASISRMLIAALPSSLGMTAASSSGTATRSTERSFTTVPSSPSAARSISPVNSTTAVEVSFVGELLAQLCGAGAVVALGQLVVHLRLVRRTAQAHDQQYAEAEHQQADECAGTPDHDPSQTRHRPRSWNISVDALAGDLHCEPSQLPKHRPGDGGAALVRLPPWSGGFRARWQDERHGHQATERPDHRREQRAGGGDGAAARRQGARPGAVRASYREAGHHQDRHPRRRPGPPGRGPGARRQRRRPGLRGLPRVQEGLRHDRPGDHQRRSRARALRSGRGATTPTGRPR